ncbi:MAG: hypothetical protein ACT4QF_16165 [Sporichthyaceae bacterium]
MAAGALVAGSLTLGAPAQAATGTAFCFVWSTGPAYAGLPVTLEQWDGFRWVATRSALTGPNGCGTFYGTPAGAAQRVSAVYWALPNVWGGGWYGSELFCGATPRMTVPGWGTAFIGTGVVIRCA